MQSFDDIAEELNGYDMQSLRLETANNFLRAAVFPVDSSEIVSLKEALNRVVAEDVTSQIDVPAHNNSAMDGFAFPSYLLSGSFDLTLKVAGTILAGVNWTGNLMPHECVKIMTGAVMPRGIDTVIPHELVRITGDYIQFNAAAIRPGANRRDQGEDLRKGCIALGAGTRIGPAALGLLASLGIHQIRVKRKLRVSIFSTGNEILGIGEKPREGSVYDSNRYTLYGLLTRLGIEVEDLGQVPDDLTSIADVMEHASGTSDAVISSGGVSGGDADHTKLAMQMVTREGGEFASWSLAMRPGRPMAIGRINQTMFFGLPGNPVAAMVNFLTLVRPALLRMMGCRTTDLPLLKARSTHAIKKQSGRTEYQRAVVSHSEGGTLQVCTTGSQGSGILNSMVHANGLLALPHDAGNLDAGTEVDVMMFDGFI
jgi:molybdopterin molybdotransferase